jgi:hypothetical protein
MKQLEVQKETETDPYTIFVYSLRSPYTKESYFRRLRRFFNAISLEGPTFEIRCNLFAERGKHDPNWAFNCILKFVVAEKQRVENKEITGGTLRNSVKTIKTFCEVTDVLIPWKVHKYLGTLGPKLYFLRLPKTFKNDDEYRAYINNDDFIAKTKKIEQALLDYLNWFELCPHAEKINGIAKIKMERRTKGRPKLNRNNCQTRKIVSPS